MLPTFPNNIGMPLFVQTMASLMGWVRNATGAVFRWASDKFSEVVTPDDFFVVGVDTDYGNACTLAIAYLQTTAGGVLWFPPKAGGYTLPSGVLTPGNLVPIEFRFGGVTIYHSGTGNLFTIIAGFNPFDPKHKVTGNVECYAVTPNTGVGIYIEDCGSQSFSNIVFNDFEFDIWQNNVTQYCEQNTYKNVFGHGGSGGVKLTNSGSTHHSMATTSFYGCSFTSPPTNGPTPANWVGFSVGTNVSIYRSCFKALTLFPSTPNAVGFYSDGGMDGADLTINIEDTGGPHGWGSVGVQIGPNADHMLSANVGGDLRGVDTNFVIDPANVNTFAWRVNNTTNGVAMAMRTSVFTMMQRIVDLLGNTLWQITRKVDNSAWIVTSDVPVSCQDPSGNLQQWTGYFGGQGVIATVNATTFSVANLGSPCVIHLQNTLATNFQQFTGGKAGQEIILLGEEAFTKLKHNIGGAGSLELQGSTDMQLADGTNLRLLYNGFTSRWQQTCAAKTP